MIEVGENLPFAPETPEQIGGGYSGSDQLDRYLFLILIVGAPRKVYRTHTATAEFSIDTVKADLLARFRGCVLRSGRTAAS